MECDPKEVGITTGHRHINPEDGNINNEDENILPKNHSQRTLRSIPYNQG